MSIVEVWHFCRSPGVLGINFRQSDCLTYTVFSNHMHFGPKNSRLMCVAQ